VVLIVFGFSHTKSRLKSRPTGCRRMLPFVVRRIGADPATSSAPFVATLVDVTGLIIYFSIALLIMRGVML
jgi:Mg/Co/Ni transporter MgtE